MGEGSIGYEDARKVQRLQVDRTYFKVLWNQREIYGRCLDKARLVSASAATRTKKRRVWTNNHCIG